MGDAHKLFNQLDIKYETPPPRQVKSNTFGELSPVSSEEVMKDFMYDDLAKSGLVPEDMGCRINHLPASPALAEYFIPYFNLDGTPVLHGITPLFFRMRRNIPKHILEDKENDVGKYRQPGKPQLPERYHGIPYIAPQFWDLAPHSEHGTVFICEGEKKAASLMKHLGLPAIGIGGKDCWHAEKGSNRVHPWILEALKEVEAERVVVIPDGDYSRPHIRRSYSMFVMRLRNTGFPSTSILVLPDQEDKLDDLIVAWGDNVEEEWLRLLERGLTTEVVEDGASLITQYNLISGNEQGTSPAPCEANYIRLMREHPAFSGIWFNDDITTLMYDNIVWEDGYHNMEVLEFLQFNLGIHRSSKAQVENSILKVALERRRSPFLDYVRDVTWDGEERLEEMFIRYCGVEDTKLARETGKRWLPASIRRMLNPGCMVDYMVIAVGGQAIGKSSFPNILWGSRNVSDHLGTDTGKDEQMRMHSGLCVNWEELSSFNKKDFSHLKALITIREESLRLPYGRGFVSKPRHSVMYGSINEREILQADETGHRRFVILEFKQVDFKALETDRDQLWAEAYVKAQDYDLDTTNIPGASAVAAEYVKEDGAFTTFIENLVNGEPPVFDYVGVEDDDDDKSLFWVLKVKEAAGMAGLGELHHNHYLITQLKRSLLSAGFIQHKGQVKIRGEVYSNPLLATEAVVQALRR